MDEANKARERAQFDRAVQQFYDGDVRAHIAHVLRIWAQVQDGGSYAEQCRIMADEVMKLALPDGVPDCGACPGDGTICPASCRLMEESPHPDGCAYPRCVTHGSCKLRCAASGVQVASPAKSNDAAPLEFWNLIHEWSELGLGQDDRQAWIEHRFGELFDLARAEGVRGVKGTNHG